jgi:hypothetical protein
VTPSSLHNQPKRPPPVDSFNSHDQPDQGQQELAEALASLSRFPREKIYYTIYESERELVDATSITPNDVIISAFTFRYENNPKVAKTGNLDRDVFFTEELNLGKNTSKTKSDLAKIIKDRWHTVAKILYEERKKNRQYMIAGSIAFLLLGYVLVWALTPSGDSASPAESSDQVSVHTTAHQERTSSRARFNASAGQVSGLVDACRHQGIREFFLSGLRSLKDGMSATPISVSTLYPLVKLRGFSDQIKERGLKRTLDGSRDARWFAVDLRKNDDRSKPCDFLEGQGPMSTSERSFACYVLSSDTSEVKRQQAVQLISAFTDDEHLLMNVQCDNICEDLKSWMDDKGIKHWCEYGLRNGVYHLCRQDLCQSPPKPK